MSEKDEAIKVLAEMEKHAPLPNPVAFYAAKLRAALGVVGTIECVCGPCKAPPRPLPAASLFQAIGHDVDEVLIFGWSSRDGCQLIERPEAEIADVVDQLREHFNLDWIYFFSTLREVFQNDSID